MADRTATLSVNLEANATKLVQSLGGAATATQKWAEEAGRSVEKVKATIAGVSFESANRKLTSEVAAQIALQHQLDVARAAGDKATIKNLEQELELRSRIRTLLNKGATPAQAGQIAAGQVGEIAAAAAAARHRREMEAEAAELAEKRAASRERIVGSPGAALEGVFSRTRLGVLEEGGAKIPIFGSALEELGAAGLIAGAGLLVAAEGAEKVHQSLEFAEELYKTAKTLGVSTTQLQEFNFALAGTPVGVAKGQEALQQFNEVFGKYSAGLASGKTAKFLDALGFTPESARELGSTQEALEKTLEALAKIQNPQQRASLATQLGLKEFLPVLAEGQEGVENFLASMKRAQSEGGVIPPDVIKRAAELNDKIEQLNHLVGIELKEAFISLGPIILELAKLTERVAHGLADFVAGFGPISNLSKRQAGEAADASLSARSAVYSTGLAGKIDPKTGRATGGILSFAYNNHQDDYEKANARIAAVDALDAAAAKEAGGGRGTDLGKPPKAKSGPSDQTESLDKSARDAYESALKALATATAALTGDIDARAELEKEAVDADLSKKLTDLSKQEGDIRKAKLDSHKREQIALIEKAKTEEQNAAAAKKEKIDRDAAAALREQELQDGREADALTARSRTAKAAVTPGQQGRADADLLNFKAQQFDDLKVQAAALDKRSKANGGDLSQAQIDQLLQTFKATQADELVAKRDSAIRGANPLYALGHSLDSVSDDLQSAEAKGVTALGDGLQGLITGTKDVKTAFHDMAMSIINDLLQIAIKRSIEAPLANLLFGGATGNIGATGGSGVVGDLFGSFLHFADGGPVPGSGYGDKVPALLTPGEFVLSHDMLGNLRTGAPSRGSAGGATVLNFDLRGAVTSDAHLAQMHAIAARYAGAVSAQTSGILAKQARTQRQSFTP